MKLKWIVPVELGPTVADTRRIVVMAETKGQALLAAVDKLSAGERERAYIAETNIELAPKGPKKKPVGITIEQKDFVLNAIDINGLDYAFQHFSKFEDIKDERFHALRENYLKAAQDMLDFLNAGLGAPR